MGIWSVAVFLIIFGIGRIGTSGFEFVSFGKIRKELGALGVVHHSIQDLIETLRSGTVPEDSAWSALKELPDPWGRLIHSSLNELRSQGGSILPTLIRIQILCADQIQSLNQAKARSGQALAQSTVCFSLIPLFGFGLYRMLPGVQEEPQLWVIACSIAALLCCIGSLWLIRIAEQARWGGLKHSERSWVLGAFSTGEFFLALLRSGLAPDVAWSRSIEALRVQCPGLAQHWNATLWNHRASSTLRSVSPTARTLIESGQAIQRGTQQALFEGRPCLERVEAILSALKSDYSSQVDRELNLVATRALKPLFITVAPALMGMLASGLFLSWLSVGSEW